MPRSPTRPPRADAPQRIAKLLARAGVASRREIERMIAEGRVAIGGKPVETPATLLTSLDGVTVDGVAIAAPEPARLFLYHKPAGLLVTERDPRGRATIYDRLPPGLPRVMPVGRLDLATEGLLLLTTDGGLKRQLELPATGVERAYRARAYGQVTQAALEDLIHGVEIEGVRYGPIDANIERRTGANLWIELVLTEGKNREVRRVLDHLGLQVSRLIRTRYGPFVLGDLPPGAVGEVRGHDVASFRKNPTRRDLPQPARRSVTSPSPSGEGLGWGMRLAPSPPAPTPTPLLKGRSLKAPAREPERPSARQPRPAKPPRVRADGTVAVRSSSARAGRAKAFRDGAPAPSPAPIPPRGRGKPKPGPARPPRTRR